jgi:hypothetical protein
MSWNFAGASALCAPALNARAHEASAKHGQARVLMGVLQSFLRDNVSTMSQTAVGSLAAYD